MKTQETTNVEIKRSLSPQDVIQIIRDLKIDPKDSKFYSFEVIGLGISKGCEIIIRYSSTKDNP